MYKHLPCYPHGSGCKGHGTALEITYSGVGQYGPNLNLSVLYYFVLVELCNSNIFYLLYSITLLFYCILNILLF